ncbi:MAG: sodium:proton antiporter [Rhodospirillales bacterium]
MVFAAPGTAGAAEEGARLSGADLSVWWAAPFCGLLLSIALLPLLTPRFFYRRDNEIIAGWAALVVAPLFLVEGAGVAVYELIHVMLLDYVPFICLLTALYTIAGGIKLSGPIGGSPAANATMLGAGTLLAGWIGTTGASMLLVRSVIAANKERRYNVHVLIFFIFLVSNIGGALSPLGDPPLFLGFLRGVEFFWPLKYLAAPTVVVTILLLATFWALDRELYRRERPAVIKRVDRMVAEEPRRLRVQGKANFALMCLVILAVMLSGTLDLGVAFTLRGIEITGESVARDVLLVALTCASLRLTPEKVRQANHFTWAPMIEVAKVFAGIFVAMIPPLAMLRAGREGPLAGLLLHLTHEGQPVDAMYFVLTGLLSSFLDNAPTYLVFFNAAGGDAGLLMGPLASTLTAISVGAVFMGANTYIGNAPNLMVRSIAESQGIRMPSFLGYMLWSLAFLGPVFLLIALLFF